MFVKSDAALIYIAGFPRLEGAVSHYIHSSLYIPHENHLNTQQSTPRLQLRSPQPMLIENKHLSFPSEAEVRRSSFHQDPAEENTTRRPDGHSITTPRVHISIEVAFDTVWNTNRGHGEETAIGQERFTVVVCHVECVTASPQLLAINPHPPQSKEKHTC